MNWYEITNIEEVDSPSLLLFKQRMLQNIGLMLKMVDNDAERIMPHVKTNKCIEVVQAMISKGIHQFKASTIAEAEMVALAGGAKVLIAHQLVGPKVRRFIEIQKAYPKTEFSFLIDNITHLKWCENLFESKAIEAKVYIDVNNGMNRTGVQPQDLGELIKACSNSKYVKLQGVHVYDGHHRQEEFEKRLKAIEEDFEKIDSKNLKIIAGGSPAFSIHAISKNRICSPGTSVFWDWGYGDKFEEQAFLPAAILVTRVISKPKEGIITVDLGHKAVAAENPIDKRIRMLNLSSYELLSQSEEHGVISTPDWNKIEVGDVFYAIPYHVCPTVNLFETLEIVEEQRVVDSWNVIARKRKINY